MATYRASDSDLKERFVFHAAGRDGHGGSSYIDSVVLRDKDASTAWTAAANAVDECRYYCQNWGHAVSAVVNSDGSKEAGAILMIRLVCSHLLISLIICGCVRRPQCPSSDAVSGSIHDPPLTLLPSSQPNMDATSPRLICEALDLSERWPLVTLQVSNTSDYSFRLRHSSLLTWLIEMRLFPTSDHQIRLRYTSLMTSHPLPFLQDYRLYEAGSSRRVNVELIGWEIPNPEDTLEIRRLGRVYLVLSGDIEIADPDYENQRQLRKSVSGFVSVR